MRMRERSSTSLRTAASAAIAPHRIPLFRTMYIVAGTILFFFLNLYFIYMYVQNQTDDALEETVEVQEPLQPQPLHPGAPLPVSSSYSCNITDPLALSALARVKTESCMKKITDAACRLKNGAFHDRFPESQCGNHDSLLIDLHVGCFEDHKSNRTLNGFSYDFKDDNSAAKCRSFCYRAGFVYYGLEFGRECFCGDSVSSKPLSQTKCSTYKCSGNDSQFCGGFNAIDVFHTGLKRAHLMPKAVFESDSYVRTKRPRILFLLQLNGRNERQVKRLLKALYSPYHYYYIHVDQRQLYMLTEMKAVAAKVGNVFVAPDAHSTIWGGASLLTMVQDTIRQSIALPSISDWDYLVNLSESDFPVMTLQEFETQLHANLGKSYMSSHGYNAARFIQKQGFDFVFVECENRMWRIGKRDEFPRNLRIDGGSDWIVLHREFAEYSISDEDLPTKLRALFSSIILPVESFFHTLSYNSRFCERSIGSNLRLTNWNRKQGCRCASLKKVVDWCGCSPLVFTKEHTHKFAVKNAIAKPFYFARKFESLVDIDAIASAEKQAMRDRPYPHASDVMFNVTFVNHYKADIDGYSVPFSMMAESLLSMHSVESDFISLSRIDVVKMHSSAPHQMVFTMQTRSSAVPLQLLATRKTVANIVSPAIANGFKLEVIMAGINIDHKEEFFRGITAYADLRSSPTVALRWSRVVGMATTVNETKTSPSVRFTWRGPDQKVIATQKLHPYDSVRGIQFASLDLQKLNATNLKPGMWNVVVQTDVEGSSEILGNVWFPIYSTEDKPLFRSLVSDFFTVKDSCTTECSSTTWSTFHPDPKSDILFGYDEVTQSLV